MKHLILFALLVTPALLRADGGTVRFSQVQGPYRVTLLTSPVSPRAGVVDFSVLVQDAATDRPRYDVPVRLQAWPAGQPQHAVGGLVTGAGTVNKLYRHVELDLHEAGEWTVTVRVSDAAPIETTLAVGPPLPGWLDLLPWVVSPLVVIVLFVIHQRLSRDSHHPAA